VVSTNTATFYITGVQLEVGSSATGFEYRQYQQELVLCYRYYQKLTTFDYIPGFTFSTNRVLSGVPFTAPMRIAPTITAATTSFTMYTAGTAQTSSAVSLVGGTNGFITIDATVTATNGVAGGGSLVGPIQVSAEL
jgi:hypothetical protein